jgi:ABC-type polysaccharide/polyol phosphate export permease
MFIGVLLSSTLVVREKTSPSYFRNFITPTGDGMFVLGDYATNVFVLLLQLTIIFGVSLIFFKEALYTVMLNSSIVLLLVVSVFIMLGMFIGQVFKSEETNTLGAVSISAILLFFSSTILPLETLPGTVRSIANLNPFVIGEGMLKEVMVFNQGLMSVVEPIIILLVYILVLGFLIFTLRKVSKRFL